MFKSCSRRVGDSRWWGSLTAVPAASKAKRLSSVNYATKTIHHHHHIVNQNSLLNQIYFVSLRYNEIARYDFKNHNGNGTVGHFTQVVWKGSRKVGMGIAKVTKNGVNKVYVVARYAPPRNYVAKNAENVMPIKDWNIKDRKIYFKSYYFITSITLNLWIIFKEKKVC